jgi:hypothetical protein
MTITDRKALTVFPVLIMIGLLVATAGSQSSLDYSDFCHTGFDSCQRRSAAGKEG